VNIAWPDHFGVVAGAGIGRATGSGNEMWYRGLASRCSSSNVGNNPDVMRETIRRNLRDWQSLPAASRRPGAI
jgi:hypothetical protein